MDFNYISKVFATASLATLTVTEPHYLQYPVSNNMPGWLFGDGPLKGQLAIPWWLKGLGIVNPATPSQEILLSK